MKGLKSFFSEDNNCNKFCLRRFMGAVGFITCIVSLYHPGINVEQYVHFLYASTALLGLTTVDKFIKKNG